MDSAMSLNFNDRGDYIQDYMDDNPFPKFADPRTFEIDEDSLELDMLQNQLEPSWRQLVRKEQAIATRQEKKLLYIPTDVRAAQDPVAVML